MESKQVPPTPTKNGRRYRLSNGLGYTTPPGVRSAILDIRDPESTKKYTRMIMNDEAEKEAMALAQMNAQPVDDKLNETNYSDASGVDLDDSGFDEALRAPDTEESNSLLNKLSAEVGKIIGGKKSRKYRRKSKKAKKSRKMKKGVKKPSRKMRRRSKSQRRRR